MHILLSFYPFVFKIWSKSDKQCRRGCYDMDANRRMNLMPWRFPCSPVGFESLGSGLMRNQLSHGGATFFKVLLSDYILQFFLCPYPFSCKENAFFFLLFQTGGWAWASWWPGSLVTKGYQEVNRLKYTCCLSCHGPIPPFMLPVTNLYQSCVRASFHWSLSTAQM